MPKNIEQGRTKQRRKTLGNGWTRNVLKSLGYSAMDVITEIMPNTSSMIQGIAETKSEIHDTSNLALDKAKELSEQMQTKLKQFKEEDLRAAIEDIKSGKLHGRLKDSDSDFDFGNDMDFGGLDENFDLGEDNSSSSASPNVTVNMSMDESPIVEAQVATVKTIADGVKHSTDLHKVGYGSIITSIGKMSVGLSTKLDLVHSEIGKISSIVPKSLTEHAYVAAKYYEESIGYQKKISESLLEMKDMYAGSMKIVGQGPDQKSKLKDIAYGVDISDYKDIVNKQFKETVGSSMLGVTLGMLKDMHETQAMANESIGGKTGLMETATKMMVKNILPGAVKKSTEKMDELLQGLLLAGGMKISKLSNRWDSSLMKFLGDTFGIKSKPDLTVDKKDYEKGAVAFDGKVHRAITDIIPTYLRMITSALTGKEEVTFDYEKGKFATVRSLRENFKKELRQSATNQYFSETWDFNSIVDSLKDISEEQNKEIKESFQDMIYNMSKTGDFVTFRKQGDKDDIAKFTGRSSDDPVVALIREYFEGLVDQGRQNEVNEFFSSKLVKARQSLEEKYKLMTKDATTGNFNIINNGLTAKDQGNIRATAEGGLMTDKYGRTTHSYLRDILGTLATGIKVVNVGTIDGNPANIVGYSNRILAQLDLDNNVLRANIAAANSPTPSTGMHQITFSMDEAKKGIEKTLGIRDYGDWLDDKAEYSDEDSFSGKLFRKIKKKRDKLKSGATRITNAVSNAAIDAIYGRRSITVPAEETEDGTNPSLSGGGSPTIGGPGGGGGGSPIVDENNPEAPRVTILPNPSAIPQATNMVMGQVHNNLRTMGEDFVNDIIHPLEHSLFNEEDGLITQIEETNLNGDNNNEKVEKKKEEIVSSIKGTVKSIIQGEEDKETGQLKNGLLSGFVNDAREIRKKSKDWAHEMVFGSEDGSIKGINQYLRDFFGQQENGSLSVTNKAKEGFGAFKEHFKKRAYEWTDLLFGPEEEGEEKKLDVFLGDMKGKKGLIGASAVVGAVGSFFLPGGPIGGALIGAGLGMASQSTQFKEFLFGKEDKETGEHTGGLISQKWQDYFHKVKKPLTIGAGVGLMGSFFLPGGPITGALVGAGLGMVTKTEAFSKLLYGDGGTKEDPTGGITKFIKDHYSKDRDIKSSFMDAGIGAGVGLMGSFFLPGGPITGALIGAATNIAINTDKFKDFFFGKEDEETKQREGGLFGTIKSKVTEKVDDVKDRLGGWIDENVLNPLKVSMEPIKNRAKKFLFGDQDDDGEKKGLLGHLADRLDQSVFGDLKRSFKENVIDKMKDGFHKLFGGITGFLGNIIKSPFTALRAYAQGIEEEDANANGTTSTFTERLQKLNEESKKKREERRAARKKASGKKAKETDAKVDGDKEESKVVSSIPDDIKAAAEIAKQQLDATKSNHEETKGLLTRIAESVTERLENFKSRKKGLTDTDEDSPIVADSGNLISKHDYLDSINSNVKQILHSVDGQLNGTGWNLNRIYKLLRKRLKKGDEEDDGEDSDGEEEGSGPFRKFYRFRDLVRGGKDKLKNLIFAPIRWGKKLIAGIKRKVVNAFNKILAIPKAIIGAFKKVVPSLIKITGKVIGGITKTLYNVVKTVGPTLIKLTGKVISGIAKTGWNLVKSLGGFIKPLAKGFVSLTKTLVGAGIAFGKGAWNVGKKVVKGGIQVAKGVANKIFHRKGKNKEEFEKHFILDGGVLDTVNTINVVKMVEDIKEAKRATGEKPDKIGKIIPFPGNQAEETQEETAQVAGDAKVAAATGRSNPFQDLKKIAKEEFSGLWSKAKLYAKEKKESSMAKIKGSAESIRAKFSKENMEEKKEKFLSKITGLLARNTESTEKHSSVWSSIFSKKGLITAGLILLSPLIFKAVKGIIKFFGESGLGQRIAEALGSFTGTIGKDVSKSMEQEGGLGGMVNNASEQARAATNALGLTNREDYVINPDGTIARDEDGNFVTKERKRGFVGRMIDFYMPVKAQVDNDTGKIYNNRVYNHDTVARAENTFRIGHRVAKKIKKFTDSKVGQKLGTFGKKGLAKAGSALKDLGGKALQSDKVQSIIKFGKKAIQIMLDKLGGFISKHGGKSGNILTKIGKELIEKVLNGSTIGQFLGKFGKCFAKTAAAAGTALASDVVSAGIGAIGGAINAAELFEVRNEDVDAKMRLVAAAVKGLANLSCFCWLEVIFDIFYSITGINVMGAIATALYKAISSDEDDAKLDEAKDNFDSDYEAHLKEEYEAYAQNEEAAGNTPMSFEEFKGSDLATSKADYNTEKNHMGLIKTATNVWNKAKNKTQEKIRGVANTIVKARDFGKNSVDAIKNGVKNGIGFIKNGWNFVKDAHEKGSAVISDAITGNTKGIRNIVFSDLAKAWFDTEGGYYISNGDGTFHYYNTNGEVMIENVPGDEVKQMIQKGLLVSDKIPPNTNISTAKTVIKAVKKDAKGAWGEMLDSAKKSLKSFKEAAKEGWEAVRGLGKKVWNGFTSLFDDESEEEATASGGKGDESPLVSSSSGMVNGFPYYSQNDPSIRNKAFNLSSGETDTMGARGCGPTAMSMVASQLTGQKVDPVMMAQLATSGGYSTDVGTTPEYFQNAASAVGLKSQSVLPTKEAIAASLRGGNPIILQGQDSREDSPFTSGGHYVVGVGMNGDNLIVNDPRGKQYSKEYDLNSVLGGVQNVWGFSNGSSPMMTTAPAKTVLGMGGKSQGVAGDTLNNFPYFLQGDDRWGGTQYSATGDPSQTIASSACGPTSMAMVLRSYGANVTPVDTAQYALDNGYRTANSGTSWGFFSSIGGKYGLSTQQLGSAQEAVNSLQEGKPVIASMGPSTFTKGGHYIVLSGINEEGKIIVNDPGKLARSNVTYDPAVFASEGKQFWSFSKDGKGSINNVTDAGEVRVTTPKEALSGMVGTAMNTAITAIKKTGSGEKITEGTPEGGTIPDSQAETANEGQGGNENSPGSILEFISGAASAFLSPIMNFLTGKKNENNVGAAVVGATDSINGLVSNLTGGTNATGGITPSGLSYVRNGDYLGKYTAQFESGNKGPTAISSGAGDYGGVSFGTYQFATQNAAQVAANSQLARFWNANYAANHPGVAPGNNQAFKDAWLYEANNDMKGFQDRETSFMADNFYQPQVKKLSDIVNPDTYDRGLQEDIYATSIQFGPNTGVIQNALAGKDVRSMKPADVINAIQDYKVANNATLFASSSQKIRDAAKHRHDVTERNVMLGLAGKPPINPTQVAVDETPTVETDGEKNQRSPVRRLELKDTTTTGGFGEGPKVHGRAPKPLIGGKGEGDNPIMRGMESMAKGIETRTPSISTGTSFRQPTVASKAAGNVLLNKVIELLGHIVENTMGINEGVQELYHKDFGGGGTQVIAPGGNNSIIPLNAREEDVDPRSTVQYQTAKRMSAGVYLN